MLIPNLTTTREIQTNYRTIFNQSKSKGPVVVMTNNKPDVVIMSIADAEYLLEKTQEIEMRAALQAIKSYKRAKQTGK